MVVGETHHFRKPPFAAKTRFLFSAGCFYVKSGKDEIRTWWEIIADNFDTWIIGTIKHYGYENIYLLYVIIII